MVRLGSTSCRLGFRMWHHAARLSVTRKQNSEIRLPPENQVNGSGDRVDPGRRTAGSPQRPVHSPGRWALVGPLVTCLADPCESPTIIPPLHSENPGVGIYIRVEHRTPSQLRTNATLALFLLQVLLLSHNPPGLHFIPSPSAVE